MGNTWEDEGNLFGLTVHDCTVSPNRKTYYADADHCVYHAEYVEQTMLLVGWKYDVVA